MGLRLSELVQVRQESWGLLFYSQTQHRLLFIKSGQWLNPDYFKGRWTVDGLVADVVSGHPASSGDISTSLRKLIDNLIKNGMLINELH